MTVKNILLLCSCFLFAKINPIRKQLILVANISFHSFMVNFKTYQLQICILPTKVGNVVAVGKYLVIFNYIAVLTIFNFTKFGGFFAHIPNLHEDEML